MSEHPQDFPDPNYDSPSMHEVSHPRRNGCSCPWHPFQLIAWFFILLFSMAHYGFLAFYVPGLWRIAIYVVSFLSTRLCINHQTSHSHSLNPWGSPLPIKKTTFCETKLGVR